MWKCPACETINKDEICAVCGEKRPSFQQQQMQQEYSVTNSTVNVKEKNRIGIVICIVLLVLLIGVSILCAVMYFNLDDGIATPAVAEKTVKEKYDYIGEFKNGLAVVKLEGKYGYINEDYELVIDNVYDEAEVFDAGHACVKKSGQPLIIDEDGERVLRQFDVAINMYYPPLEYYDDYGNSVGFDIEFLDRLAEDMNFEYELVDMDFDQVFLSVQTGKTDFAISGLMKTSERDSSVDFTDSYVGFACTYDGEEYYDEYHIAVPEGSELAQEFNYYIEKYKNDGFIDELKEKWKLEGYVW